MIELLFWIHSELMYFSLLSI